MDGDAPAVDGELPRWFREIYEHAPVAMHSLDEAGCIRDVNRAWLELLGYSREEVLGAHASRFLTEESARRSAEEVIPRLWRDGMVRAIPYDIVRKDGSILETEIDANATGSIGRRMSITTIRDVGSRNRAIRALSQREAELRTMIDRSPDVILLHRAGRIVYANIRAAGLLGAHDPNQLIGEPLPSALATGDALPEPHALTEVRVADAQGGERLVEVARMAVHFEELETEVVVARDLTERRMLQTRLAQADRLATVGTLAASVAHEINNPLTYVMHYMQALRRDLASVRERLVDHADRQLARDVRRLEEGAETADEGCRRVRDIVGDLKSFGRMDEGPVTALDVNRALRSAVQMATHQMRARAHLTVELGSLPVVLAHEGRLCQVFINLLMNAAQSFDGAGSATERADRTLRVSTSFERGQVIVTVADSGAGIPADHLGRLFEPFFSTKPRPVGSGLGLWISREIIHELGGHIEVESELGRGSIFRVVLPAAGVVSTASMPADALEVPAPRRILVVDDEVALRELLAEALSERAQVMTASSGIEARALLEQEDGGGFDVILCDLMMPDMNGVELYEWIRETHPAMIRRMVFMTGAAYTRRARDFLSSVHNERLDKPFRVRDLEQVVERVMERGEGG